MITKININNSLIVKIDLITLTHIRIRIWKLELLSNIAKLSLKNRSTYSYVWYNTLLFILIYIYIYISYTYIYVFLVSMWYNLVHLYQTIQVSNSGTVFVYKNALYRSGCYPAKLTISAFSICFPREFVNKTK